MKIEVVKTEYGFEYLLGKLVIARGDFIKSKGEWKLRLWHMQPKKTKFGIATCGVATIIEVKDTFAYLNALIYPD